MILRRVLAAALLTIAAPALAANPATKMNGVQLTPLASSPVAAGGAGISADASSLPRWDDAVTRKFLVFSASLGLAGQCLVSAGAGAAATWASCGGGGGGTSTLAASYTAGTTAADSTISLDATRGKVTIKDNATPIGGLVDIQASNGTSKFLFDASNLTFGVNRGIATASGIGAFDFSNANGAFKTTTGAHTFGAAVWTIKSGATTVGTLGANNTDGIRLADGAGSSSLGLSTNAGTTLCYSSACYSAGSGSATIGDGTGTMVLSAGTLTLTIISGIPDADGTRDWGTLAKRWRTFGSKRILTGQTNLTFSATPAFDCTAANHISIGTITANVTGPTMVAGSSGEECTITFVKDATAGAFTIAGWGSNVRFAGTATFTTGAGSLVTITFWWNANLSTPAWVEKSRAAYN